MFDAPTESGTAVLGTAAALAALLLVGCGESPPTDLDPGQRGAGVQAPASRAGAPGQLDPELRSRLVELKQATAGYHDLGKAEADGWNTRFPPECLTHADAGGMGQHFLNEGLLDERVSVDAPEFLVYEPRADGSLHLVAVEYVVPFTERPREAEPPTLFGHEFHANETYGVWAFHVWAWRHNTAGIFADWNPRVSCEHADEVRIFPAE